MENRSADFLRAPMADKRGKKCPKFSPPTDLFSIRGFAMATNPPVKTTITRRGVQRRYNISPYLQKKLSNTDPTYPRSFRLYETGLEVIIERELIAWIVQRREKGLTPNKIRTPTRVRGTITIDGKRYAPVVELERHALKAADAAPLVRKPGGDGWYVFSNPIITANWNSSGEKWQVPIGGGVGRLFRVGKPPIKVQLGIFDNVITPKYGARWQTTFEVTFIF
jgi:hypothetical protein